MSNDEDIEVDAGIEEAIAGGMFKAIKSSNYMKTLLAVSAAFKKVDHDLWKQHYDQMYEMLNQTADEFPLKLPSDLNLDQMAKAATGVMVGANIFQYSLEGYGELSLMKFQLEKKMDRFRRDNA